MNETKILVIGGRGQVGSALSTILADRATTLNTQQLDLSKPDLVIDTLNNFKPKIIVNAAAYTQVDKAESERDLAMAINSESPKNMAKWSVQNDAVLIHYSTDYVYPGVGEKPYHESDTTNPVNFYGQSKLAGDQNILHSGCKHIILRTSWVYNAAGKNFLNTILRLAREKESLTIVEDQVGAPTYARHLAEATIKILSTLESRESPTKFPSGVYHLCNSGFTNWYEFAKEIVHSASRFEKLKCQTISPIPSEKYPTPAKRPKNSRMAQGKVKEVFAIEMPEWKTGLENCLKEKYASH